MSDALGGFPGHKTILRGAISANVGYLIWGVLHDPELESVRAAVAEFSEDQDVRA